MLNWIFRNRTVFDIKRIERYTELFNIELFRHLTVCKQKLYSYCTELFELELFS